MAGSIRSVSKTSGKRPATKKKKPQSTAAKPAAPAGATESVLKSTRPDAGIRRIILFSDGTANSSASQDKTNVWRLFEALDLGKENGGGIEPMAVDSGTYEQLAFYNDGVGTSGPAFYMYLSQALGLGVTRNVKKLYEQLCQHYQPGDRIYIFGFSRGAFTARVLCDMIAQCGVLDREKPAPNGGDVSMETAEGLRQGVREARRAYRNQYWISSGFIPRTLNRFYRAVRERVLGYKNYYTAKTIADSEGRLPADRDFRAGFSHSMKKMQGDSEYKDEIVTFLGVWDTVDSHGLPIDELSDLWDGIYPYKFRDFKLSPHVRFARHALALDDERQSFHPLLIDETGESRERILQVWFAGMHADVGGGYSDDNLSRNPLVWMMQQAGTPPAGPGLVFKEDAVAANAASAQPTATIHDSRRGFGVIFRYLPRLISQLSVSKFDAAKKFIEQPVVHQSALDRILDSKTGYSPIVLPDRFDIARTDGSIIEPKSDALYSPLETGRDRRMAFHDRIVRHIFWRRVAYFALLAVILSLLLIPFFEPSVPGWLSSDETGWWGLPHRFLNWAMPAAGSLIPGSGYMSFWSDVWIQSAWWFLILLGLGAVVYGWSSWIQSNIHRLAEAGWWEFKGNRSQLQNLDPGPFERLAKHFLGVLNNTGMGISVVRLARVSGLFLVIVAVLCTVLLVVLRLANLPIDASRIVCSNAPSGIHATEVRSSASYSVIRDDISNPCISSGVQIVKGRRYRITVKKGLYLDKKGVEMLRLHDPLCWRDASLAPWRDRRLPWAEQRASNRGLVCPLEFVRLRNLADNVSKRIYTYPWMVLVAQIGSGDDAMELPLNRPETRFVAQTGGKLHLFVNQNLDPSGFPWFGDEIAFGKATRHYRKLKGEVEVIINEL